MRMSLSRGGFPIHLQLFNEVFAVSGNLTAGFL